MKTLTWKDIKLREHQKNAHKGDNGHVVIIGGSKDYVGCVVFAGLAALRSGCDIVTIAAPEKVAWAINTLTPDLITKKCKGEYLTSKHLREILFLTEKADVVLIGNGLGKKKETQILIKKLVHTLTQQKKAIVLDADVFTAIKVQEVDNAILTPHENELKVLLQNSKIKLAKMQSHLRHNVLLRKGPRDIIYTKTKIVGNKTGEKRMTVAGTGDILAGLSAGFVAQGYSLFDSACYAAFFCGKLGEYAAGKRSSYYLASDLLTDIKRVMDG